MSQKRLFINSVSTIFVNYCRFNRMSDVSVAHNPDIEPLITLDLVIMQLYCFGA